MSDPLRDIIDVATGRIPHLYMGLCPDDVDGHEQRDPECAACQAIGAVEAMLPAHDEAVCGMAALDKMIADLKATQPDVPIIDMTDETLDLLFPEHEDTDDL